MADTEIAVLEAVMPLVAHWIGAGEDRLPHS
jgi:hypothetical protein